jgi:hypothetical protein
MEQAAWDEEVEDWAGVATGTVYEPMNRPASGNPQKVGSPTDAWHRFVLRAQAPRLLLAGIDMAIRHTQQQFKVQLQLIGSDPEITNYFPTWSSKEVRILAVIDQDNEPALEHFAWLLDLKELQLSRACGSETEFKPIWLTLLCCPMGTPSVKLTPAPPPPALNGPLRYLLRRDFCSGDPSTAQSLVKNAIGDLVEYSHDSLRGSPLLLAAEAGSESAVQLFAELVAGDTPWELVRREDCPNSQPASVPESTEAIGPGVSPCQETSSAPSPQSTAPLLAVPSQLQPNEPGREIDASTQPMVMEGGPYQSGGPPTGLPKPADQLPVDPPFGPVPPPLEQDAPGLPTPLADAARQGTPVAAPRVLGGLLSATSKHSRLLPGVAVGKASEPSAVAGSNESQTPAAAASGHMPQPPARGRTILEIACDYHSRGISVVPQLAGAKHPCVKWTPFQKAQPTLQQLEAWFDNGQADAGIAAILGPVSNLFAIDVDGKEAHEELVARLGGEPAAPKVLSGSGDPFRYHLFFRHPEGIATRAKITPWHPKLEFRGDRGILVMPPSLHKSGNSYRWAPGRSLENVALPEVPAAVRAALKERAAQDAAPVSGPATPHDQLPPESLPSLTRAQQRAAAYLAKVPAAVTGQGGDRQTYAAACTLVVRFGLSPEQAFPLLLQWNRKCRPPWTEDDLRRKLQVAAKEPGPRGELLKPVTTTTMPLTDEGNALANVAPTWANMYDTGLIDPSRAELFAVVGKLPRLFAGIVDWPTAEDLKQAQVACGHSQPWAARIRAIATGAGGLILTEGPNHWALRLLPAAGTESEGYHVLAIGAPRAAPVATEASSAAEARNSAQRQDGIRNQLSQHARALQLFRKAGQVLWLVHAELLRQRSARVVLPDIGIAEVLWGADPTRWPRNWRQEVLRILRSLTLLRWATIPAPEVLRDGVPQAIQKQMVFRYVQDRKVGAAQSSWQDRCPSSCPLHATSRRHYHYAVGVGAAFLGLLQRFAIAKKEDDLEFDFSPNLAAKLAEARQENEASSFERKPDQKKALKEERDQVQQRHLDLFRGLAKVPLVVPVFSPLAGVPAEYCQLLRVLVRETCRARKGVQAARADGAHVFQGKRVPGNKLRQQLSCPFLSATREYIAFNGNGRRWGQGYRLTTWASRAGYHASAPISDRSELEAIRAFLVDLVQLAKQFDLVVAGLRSRQWYSLLELREMAKTAHHLPQLRLMGLRIYAAADCYMAWRRRLAATMPPATTSVSESAGADQVLALKTDLKQAGIRQQELATYLGKGRSYITKLLAGVKPFPEALRKQVRAFIDQRMQKPTP